MSTRPPLDPRRASALAAELRRRAVATLTGNGLVMPVGQVADAMLRVAARIGEEVTRRLDAVPEKQEDNFFTAMGIGRDPARPARVPVSFKLADPAPDDVVAPKGTRLMAETDGPPVFFETERGIALVPGAIAALAGVDTASDAIFLSPDGVAGGALPRTAPPRRSVRGGAGAAQIQVTPASGLDVGAVLSLGAGEAARQHRVTAIEGELVTIAPPLEAALAAGAPAVEVTGFVPFGGASRNRQSHALYLGHATLLDVPSKLDITVTGTPLPADARWSWWGKPSEDVAADWQPLRAADVNGRLQLGKEKGKPVAKVIGGKESLWLRAELPGGSPASVKAREIRIAIADAGLCGKPPEERCDPPGPMAVEFEAVANTTPIVPNSPFHPFGREPRLFDSFYIGCAEAFGKKRAEISLCFELGGPKLGPMAAISYRGGLQAFGVGTDGILYRGSVSDGGGQLQPFPPPRQGAGLLRYQAPVAAELALAMVHLAVAGIGEVQFARFPADTRLDPAAVEWERLPAQEQDTGKDVDQVAALIEGGDAVVHARLGSRLLCWKRTGDTFECTPINSDIAELTELKGTRSLLSVGVKTGLNRILRLREPNSAWAHFATVPADDLPGSGFIAWARAATGTTPATIVVAGYDGSEESPAIRIVRVAGGSPGAATEIGLFPVDERLPLSFEPSRAFPAADEAPDLIVATDTPLRLLWLAGTYRTAGDTPAIGPSDNPHRQIVHGAAMAAVQAREFGLLYRAWPERVNAFVEALGLMADAAAVPAAAAYVTFAGAAVGPGYAFKPKLVLLPEPRLLEEVRPPGHPPPSHPPPGSQGNARLYSATGTTGEVSSFSLTRLLLENVALADDVDIALFRDNDSEDPLALPDEGIWRLELSSATTGPLRWKLPLTGFPDPSAGDLRFRLLAQQTDGTGARVEASLSLTEVAVVTNAAQLDAKLQGGPLASLYDPETTISATLTVGAESVIVFPHSLVEPTTDGEFIARFDGPGGPWSSVGPNQPANPALSWEYWNGRSWWALGGGNLADSTANLLFGGGVFFDVPADMAETEVSGRRNYWIRARLAGGDYGEAKVTAVSQPDTPEAGKTSQTIERDTSSVRAPYVTSLKVGFCARELVPPEIVLTEDNLGMIDRTGANDAGMEIPVFTPVEELMNPAPVADAATRPEDEACDEPCPLPAADAELEPDPCAAPGAADRCDSPCLGGTGTEPPPAAPAPAGFTRGLLIGFDKAIHGDPVTLYADVERGGPPTRLRAEMFRNGRFETIEIVDDRSYGLSEPGIVVLSCARTPDAAEIAGSVGHWLRIGPAGDGANWAPRLRGLYLNAVDALSIETRTLESLGHSSGVPDQVFRLSRAPVWSESLALRVHESISEEDRSRPGLSVVDSVGGMPGPWVAWEQSEDLAQEPGQKRVFALDPETGLLRFGDGRNGAIPPLGGEILAVSFAHVGGAGGNSVEAGGTLQLVSPLAGVEKVGALDSAAGGSDVEPAASARKRAPAKLRHGGHILTRADLEDFALAYSPVVAQARAQCRGGATRLIVVARGPDPRPAPALLRELARELRERGGYGLSGRGGFSAVAPVALPIGIELTLEPDQPDEFPGLAERARLALTRLFDPATGGFDGAGWPMGVLPGPDDVSAALDAISDEAEIGPIALSRVDGEQAEPLPGRIPEHLLVTLAVTDVRVERAWEAVR
jgi:hypothetical protein